jgi:hypothetical protein
MVKTVTQVVLIALNKTLKVSHPLVHMILFLAIIVLFLFFCMKNTCFGYARAAFWHALSLIVVIWCVSLGLIQTLTELTLGTLFLALTISGVILICIFGLIYQKKKLPNLLHQKPGLDPSNLFKFAFKRTTVELLNALKDNFRSVGHRNAVTPEQASEADEIQVTANEDLNSSTNVLRHPREHDLIETTLD